MQTHSGLRLASVTARPAGLDRLKSIPTISWTSRRSDFCSSFLHHNCRGCSQRWWHLFVALQVAFQEAVHPVGQRPIGQPQTATSSSQNKKKRSRKQRHLVANTLPSGNRISENLSHAWTGLLGNGEVAFAFSFLNERTKQTVIWWLIVQSFLLA